MKVVYIITLADHYGGAQVHVRDLSKWMATHGHEPHVLSGKPGIVSDTITNNGVPFHEVKSLDRSIHPIRDLLAFLQTRRILKAIKPDIVSCHSSKAGIIGRLAAKSLGIKVIFTAHGWSFTEGISSKKQILFKWIEKICALFGDHIVTVSRFDKFLALQNDIAHNDNITAIHNGMPYTPPLLDKAYNDTPQLLMVARYSEQKDHTTLINALGQLADQDWHLNLVGSGDDTPYRAMAESFGIVDKITFHGQRTDIPEYLKTQDVFLLISHWEGFPRSIIEAMRASLPVITTRTAGSPESVAQFQSGYIVPERNPEALSNAISMLISDPLRRQTMGEVGRKRYDRFFTFDIMAYNTLNIYETVLGIEMSEPPALQEHDHLSPDPQ
jgi:glycosyltransferase involved in cell wall biosynthesis